MGDSEVQIIQSNISDDCVQLIRVHLHMADDPGGFGDFFDSPRGGIIDSGQKEGILMKIYHVIKQATMLDVNQES